MAETFEDWYGVFRESCRLKQAEYKPAIKLIMYSVFSESLKGSLIKQFSEDIRIHTLILIESGGGKKELIKLIKRTVSNTVLPTHYHPEQFIGKKIFDRKTQEVFENEGYFKDAFIVIDEASDLYMNSKHEETRKYMRICKDPYGDNDIWKSSVNLPKEFRLNYYPNCVIAEFMQPRPINEELLITGDLRRDIILFLDVTEEMKVKAIIESLKDTDTAKIDFAAEKIRGKYKDLVSKKFNWNFSDEVKTRIGELTIELYKYGSARGHRLQDISKKMAFSMRNFLIKMSCIRAGIESRSDITVLDLELAFEDLKSYWISTLDYLARNMTFAKVSVPEEGRLATIFGFLMEKGAILEDTAIDYDKFFTFLESTGMFSSVKPGSSPGYRYYKAMIEKGYLSSARHGKEKTKIWIKDVAFAEDLLRSHAEKEEAENLGVQ